ncbi:hypothetical protein CGMCC3_g8554 [Colletotrichum fructicola]|nr:uncharacterized protein CGMCC3_g8554 [Colletotrichum fructicola]KAE9575243.1 hypothetical protein CGMCC3_g8554 [Colletotrichum fructicola]
MAPYTRLKEEFGCLAALIYRFLSLRKLKSCQQLSFELACQTYHGVRTFSGLGNISDDSATTNSTKDRKIVIHLEPCTSASNSSTSRRPSNQLQHRLSTSPFPHAVTETIPPPCAVATALPSRHVSATAGGRRVDSVPDFRREPSELRETTARLFF